MVATLIPISVGTLLTEFGDMNYPVPVFKNTLFTAVMEKFIINYTSMKPIFGILIEITLINFIIALFFNGIGIFTSSLFKNKVAPLIFLMFSFLGIYFFPKIFHLKDIMNPVIYGNAYEWVTGIKTLNNPKMTISLYILVMITLTILFIVLTNIRIKRINLID